MDDIDFNSLPDQFVLKCTHDSGGVVICKDKSNFDKEAAIKKLKHCYKRNYYLNTREPAYKDIKPRVIAEQFMVDETGWDLKDYKIFCFNGKPVYVEVDYNRSVKHMLNAYDLDWNFWSSAIVPPIIEMPIFRSRKDWMKCSKLQKCSQRI